MHYEVLQAFINRINEVLTLMMTFLCDECEKMNVKESRVQLFKARMRDCVIRSSASNQIFLIWEAETENKSQAWRRCIFI